MVKVLYLTVKPNGSRLWYLKYRYSGKEKKLALGAYPTVPLAEARQQRATIEILLQGLIECNGKNIVFG